LGTIFRPYVVRWRNAAGKAVKKGTPGAKQVRERAKKWYGQYRDENNAKVRTPLCRDKVAAKTMLAELERKADRARAGDIDPFDEHLKRPLPEHVADFRLHLEAKNNTPEHVELTIARITTVFSGCGFAELSHLEADRVASFLSDARRRGLPVESSPPIQGTARTFAAIAEAFGVSLHTVMHWRRLGAPLIPRRDNELAPIDQWRRANVAANEPMSIATSNHYLRAVKSFGGWLVRSRRLPSHPFVHLSALNARTDIRHERRTITAEEFDRLIVATMAAGPRRRLTGGERAVLYTVAAFTGLRAGELASLTPASFRLADDPPVVSVAAAYSKHRREDLLPLRPDVATMIERYMTGRGQGVLWPGSWSDDPVAILRPDLVAAEIPYADDAGRVFDFHALRHQFITSLAAAGVHPKEAQTLARHSTIALTLDRYTHLGVSNLTAALDALPAIPATHEGASTPGAASASLAPAADQFADQPAEQTCSARIVAPAPVAPPVAPGVGDLWGEVVLDCPSEVATVELQETKKPSVSQGFTRVSPAFSEELSSEADGTRTRNHRIDSPSITGFNRLPSFELRRSSEFVAPYVAHSELEGGDERPSPADVQARAADFAQQFFPAHDSRAGPPPIVGQGPLLDDADDEPFDELTILDDVGQRPAIDAAQEEADLRLWLSLPEEVRRESLERIESAVTAHPAPEAGRIIAAWRTVPDGLKAEWREVLRQALEVAVALAADSATL